jgi:hypothetical protein
VASFEDPVALLLDFFAQACLFRGTALNPARSPVDLVYVDHLESGTLAERASESAFARTRLTDDHDAIH